MTNKNKEKLSNKILIPLLLILALFFGPEILDNVPAPTTNNETQLEFYTPAKVVRVVDGDTAIMNVAGKDERVRFIGINSPEIVHDGNPDEFYGPEAAEFTTKLLEGKKVYLESDVSGRDKYDRLLCYIWIDPPKDPQNPTTEEIRQGMANGILADKGYARARTYRPDTKYDEKLQAIGADAEKNNRGMWQQNQR